MFKILNIHTPLVNTHKHTHTHTKIQHSRLHSRGFERVLKVGWLETIYDHNDDFAVPETKPFFFSRYDVRIWLQKSNRTLCLALELNSTAPASTLVREAVVPGVKLWEGNNLLLTGTARLQ